MNRDKKNYLRLRYASRLLLGAILLFSLLLATPAAAQTTINCMEDGTGSGYATGGTGDFINEIYWLDWSCGVSTFGVGDIVNKTWTLPQGIVVTAQITNITAAISPYNTGAWTGDMLDDLYSGVNPIGLANNFDGQDPTYDIEFTLTLNGVPIPADIVAAEAEDTGFIFEKTIWVTDGDPWEPIEAIGQLSAWFSTDGRTVTMEDNPDSGSGGTLLTMTEDDATDGTTISVDMEAGGNEAIAFGIFIPFDYGDAPASYGPTEGHFVTLDASGGGRPIMSTAITSLDLATLTPQTALFLGTVAPDTESSDQNSAAADGDGNDEDGVTFSYDSDTNQVTAHITVVSDVAATLCGWVDVDMNGTFDSSERQCVSVAAGGGSYNSMTWPQSLDTSTYSRFRLSTDEAAASSPTGVAPDGELEDYQINISPTAVSLSDVNTMTPLSGQIWLIAAMTILAISSVVMIRRRRKDTGA